MTEALGLTPSQTTGPYLSIGLLRDLVPSVLVDVADPRAIRIRGRLLAERGTTSRTGWSRSGTRTRPGTTGREASTASVAPGPRTTAGSSSSPVKPGRVPWPDGGLPAPRIAVGIFARGLLKRVMARLYFPDE